MPTYNVNADVWASDAKEYVATKTKTTDNPVQFTEWVNKYDNMKGHDNWAIERSFSVNETGGFDFIYRGIPKQ